MSVGQHLKNWKILLVAATAFGCTKPAPEKKMVEKVSEDSLKLTDDAIKNIKLEKVIKGEFPYKLSLMGRISVPEDRVAVVPARVAGRIDAVFAASGEVVAPGQPLASIFSADFAIAKEEYLQALKQAKSTGDSEANRLVDLSKKKLNALGVSTKDFEKWEPSMTSDGGKGETLIVRAPRAGALIGKNAVIGNMVNVGDTLFMIGSLDKVWFAGDIYPEDLKKIKKNQEIVIDPENGSPSVHGKISFISPVVDPTSRTIKIRALMDNPGGQLRADMYVQGNIILNTTVALIAPKNSVVRLEDQIFCFKRLPGNIFKKVNVKINGEETDTISVSQGLDEGDEVVSEGGLLLDGALNGAGT